MIFKSNKETIVDKINDVVDNLFKLIRVDLNNVIDPIDYNFCKKIIDNMQRTHNIQCWMRLMNLKLLVRR